MDADPFVVFNFTTGTSTLAASVLLNSTLYSPGKPSMTAAALDVVRTQLFSSPVGGHRADAQPVVIFSVDGPSSEGRTLALAAADALKQTGARIVVVAVDVTDTFVLAELQGVASAPTDVIQLTTVESFIQQGKASLDSNFLAPIFCAPASSSAASASSSLPSTSAVPSSAIVSSSPAVLSSSAAVPSATPVATPTPFCPNFVNTDFVFSLDRSGSMFEDNFERVKAFFVNVSNALPVFPDIARL